MGDYGKPTNAVQEDLSKYWIDIEATTFLLPILVQQFVRRGYCQGQIRQKITEMKVISVKRRLPNQKDGEARFVTGNYAKIRMHFRLEHIPGI